MFRPVMASVLIALISVVGISESLAAPKADPITFTEDLLGVWDVTAHELLIVGGLGTKNSTNSATIEFFNDPTYGESFHFVNGAGIADFSARSAIVKNGAKINWHLVTEDTEVADETVDQTEFEANLSQAILEWAVENGRSLLGDPVLDIRSYAYKPIVVIKNAGSPKLGILQVKGTVTMVSDDGNGGQTAQTKNFKYKCQFSFTSSDPEPPVTSGSDN